MFAITVRLLMKMLNFPDAFEEDEEDESLGIKVYGSTVVSTTPVQSKNRATTPQDVTIRVNDAR